MSWKDMKEDWQKGFLKNITGVFSWIMVESNPILAPWGEDAKKRADKAKEDAAKDAEAKYKEDLLARMDKQNELLEKILNK